MFRVHDDASRAAVFNVIKSRSVTQQGHNLTRNTDRKALSTAMTCDTGTRSKGNVRTELGEVNAEDTGNMLGF